MSAIELLKEQLDKFAAWEQDIKGKIARSEQELQDLRVSIEAEQDKLRAKAEQMTLLREILVTLMEEEQKRVESAKELIKHLNTKDQHDIAVTSFRAVGIEIEEEADDNTEEPSDPDEVPLAQTG